MWGEVARLKQAEGRHAESGAREAIAKEAADLHQRHQGASPSERVQIERRAQRLLQLLQQGPR